MQRHARKHQSTQLRSAASVAPEAIVDGSPRSRVIDANRHRDVNADKAVDATTNATTTIAAATAAVATHRYQRSPPSAAPDQQWPPRSAPSSRLGVNCPCGSW
ncbi:unnamed protein product [Lampetra planeri]